METVHNHFAATRKSYRVVKYAEEDMYPNIRVLLGIGCSLPVSFAEAELLSLILWLATNQVNLRNRMSDEWLGLRFFLCPLMSGLALMHLHDDLEIHVDKILQSLLPSTRGGCSKGASCTSRFQVHGEGPRNYNVHRHGHCHRRCGRK